MKLYSNVYDYAIYTLNYYYVINIHLDICLFAHSKIYNHSTYTLIIIKKIFCKFFLIFWQILCTSVKIFLIIEVLECIFWGSNLMCPCVLKCIFWGSNCFDLWLLVSVTATLSFHGCWSIFFIKVLTASKTFAILTFINTNLRYITNWLQSS